MTDDVTSSRTPDSRSGTEGAPHAGAWIRIVKTVSLVVILISVLALVRLVPMETLVVQLSSRVDQLGAWGPVVFAVAYVVAAVLFIPGSALTLASGAVFGLWWGVATVSIASTTAAAVSFLIGRYAARNAVQRWAAQSPKFTAIDGAIGQGGWKIIGMLRLSPAMPFSLGNYLFGLTSIRFWPYVVTSWLAMLPGTLMYVYVGHAGRAGLSAAVGAGGGRSAGQWTMMVVGLLATVAVTVYVTRIARRAIKEQTDLASGTHQTAGEERQPTAPASGGLTATMTFAAAALMLASGAAYGHFHPQLLAGVFGPPRVELTEAYREHPGEPMVDHSLFSTVLRKYVSEEGGWVDYEGLSGDHAGLDAYIASLADAPFDRFGRDAKLALLINAYNAFTLRLILDHYPVESIKNIPSNERWDAVRWNVGGRILSLNQIEHQEIRPNFREPRVHFALVCAAVGCPPLRHEAYVAKRLEEQLTEQSRYAHEHDRWFQYEPETNVLWLTSLYSWYSSDFDQVSESVGQFAAGYSQLLKTSLENGGRPKVKFLDYDWSLNSKENLR